MRIRFEKARVEDANKLVEIQDHSFYGDLVKYGECPAYGEGIDKMEEYIETRIVYKILDGNKIIGDIIIRKQTNDEYYLRVLSIIPEYQNKGIGGRALNFIFNEYPSVMRWSLVTPQDNIRNCHFYEKHGFKKYSEEIKSERLTLNKYEREGYF